MRWYEYDQNNSGGTFMRPAIKVIVEANDEASAFAIAKRAGVDPDAPYCPCCGTRWDSSPMDVYDGKPSLDDLYGTWKDSGLYRERGVPRALYIMADGTNWEVA